MLNYIEGNNTTDCRGPFVKVNPEKEVMRNAHTLGLNENIVDFFDKLKKEVVHNKDTRGLNENPDVQVSTEATLSLPPFLKQDERKKGIDEDTKEFIEQYGLQSAISWLQEKILVFFPESDYDIELLHGEDDEESSLALKIYSSLSSLKFREKRHALSKFMIGSDQNNLFGIIDIFQWSKSANDEWEGFSDYRALLAA